MAIPGIPLTEAVKETNDLITGITAGVDFAVPNIDLNDAQFDIPGGAQNPLYGTINHLAPADVTQQVIGGTGSFDVFMGGIAVHLRKEYDQGRITGAEYTKAYIAAMQTAMGAAVQFTLSKDQVFWNNINAQLAAITGRVNLGLAKVQYAKLVLDAHTAKAQYALTGIQVATQNNQIALLREQIETAAAQTQGYRTDGTMVTGLIGMQMDQMESGIRVNVAQTNQIEKSILLTGEQIEVQHAQISDTRQDGSPYSGLIAKQLEQLTAQVNLVKEQTETQRSQTLDTRLDGAAVSGSVGKQKELYTQQVDSYKRDAEVKATKVLTDLWMAATTTGTAGTEVPPNISKDALDPLLGKIKELNRLT